MALLLYRYIRDKVKSKNESPTKPIHPGRPSQSSDPSSKTQKSSKQACEHQRPFSILLEGFTELDEFSNYTRNNTADELISSGGPTSRRTEFDNASQDIGGCSICRSEKKAMTKYRIKLFVGLFFPFLVQSLDTTIIAGASAFIASDFNQLSQLNWIISAYNLTNATFIPFWGQFADVFGRYAAIQFSAIFMLIGSTLCAASPTTAFPMLLAGRAVQGIGCAGLLIVTKVILADKVSLKDNAANNTLFTIIGAVGYGIGPVVGGYLTQASWRWCFIINIPVGLIGLVLAHFILRPELLGPQKITLADESVSDSTLPQTFTARLSTIDFGGQFLFLFGMGLLVLALTWAGSYYPWSSVKILAPLIIGIVLLIAFVAWEYLMLPGNLLSNRAPTRKAMIPIKLVLRRNVGLLLYINLVTGMAMYAVFYFVDLYFALVKGFPAGKAGTNLLYYTPGLGAGAYLALLSMNYWPLATIPPLLLGTIIEPLGITILAYALSTGNLHLIYGMLAFTGIGTGIRLMPGTIHGIGYFPSHIASIVSLMSLSVTLGGTLATTVMLNIFNGSLHRHGLDFNSESSGSFGQIAGLPVDELVVFREQASQGIRLAFYAITAFMWLGVLACCGLGNVRIGREGRGDLIKGSWVGHMLFKRGGKEGEAA